MPPPDLGVYDVGVAPPYGVPPDPPPPPPDDAGPDAGDGGGVMNLYGAPPPEG